MASTYSRVRARFEAGPFPGIGWALFPLSRVVWSLCGYLFFVVHGQELPFYLVLVLDRCREGRTLCGGFMSRVAAAAGGGGGDASV